MIKTKYFIIFDNRLLPHYDFYTEAAASSFNKFTRELIGKLIFLGHKQSLIGLPEGILLATSPTNAKLFQFSVNQLSELDNIMEPKYSSLGGNCSSNQTWKNYLSDSINKISLHITTKLNEFLTKENDTRTLILIYSTDLSLIGNLTAGSIQEGLDQFIRSAQSLNQMLRNNLKCKIICTNILSKNNQLVTTDNLFLIHKDIREKISYITFDELGAPSNLLFEEELKLDIGLISPKICSTIQLPSIQGMDCTLFVELLPHSLRSLDCIPHIKLMETCSLTTRSGISPLFMAGYGIEVAPPSEVLAMKCLGSKKSVQYNRILFETFSSWLAEKDLVLIIRVPYEVGKTEQCARFWALIPPNFYNIEDLEKINESSVRESKMELNTSSSHTLNMIMLIDRDEAIIPESDYIRSLNKIVNKFEVREDILTSDEIEDEEEEKLLKADISEYLDTSLTQAYGTPDQYKPWIFLGGKFTSEYNKIVQASYNLKNANSNYFQRSNSNLSNSKENNNKEIQPTYQLHSSSSSITLNNEKNKFINNENSVNHCEITSTISPQPVKAVRTRKTTKNPKQATKNPKEGGSKRGKKAIQFPTILDDNVEEITSETTNKDIELNVSIDKRQSNKENYINNGSIPLSISINKNSNFNNEQEKNYSSSNYNSNNSFPELDDEDLLESIQNSSNLAFEDPIPNLHDRPLHIEESTSNNNNPNKLFRRKFSTSFARTSQPWFDKD